MSKDNKDTTITFRTNQQLKKKLEQAAAKDKRTMSNMIEVIIESYLQKNEKGKG